MRIAFIILVLLHAILHLLGFFKAFRLADFKQLSSDISKPMGLLWLLSSILFVVLSILFAVKNNCWWLVGLAAIVISQILIIGSWQDAKFGTMINVVILCVSLTGFGAWNYYANYKKEVSAIFHQHKSMPSDILLASDIAKLPELVKNYLRFSGAIGKPKISNFKAEFTGKIRKDGNAPWMPFTCVQVNFLKEPSRLFFMNAEMKGFPVGVYHCFKNGAASMHVRLFSLIDIQRLQGEEMNISETVTFFNDMCLLAPASLIDDRIKWLNIEQNKVKASFTNKNITVSAWLYFDDRGALINFRSEDRYSGNSGEKYSWSTPLKNYQHLNGNQIMGDAETIYTYPDADFVYGTFKLRTIAYNLNDNN